MSVLVTVDCKAPTPRMHKDAAAVFARLQKIVLEGSGIDFLARCGDIFRPAAFRSSKDGVAMRSWHKTGRAFDYDQTSKAIIVVSDPIGGKQYFITYLKCANQSGGLGTLKTLRGYNGGSYSGYVFDFTKAAESLGFKRIPAWRGWQRRYNRREFWHYQFDQGLTWDAAMRQLNVAQEIVPKDAAAKAVLGLNDRGDAVLALQKRLIERGLLASNEGDGVFGVKTKAAVIEFQRTHGLATDGLAGPNTRKALGL